MNSYIRKLHTKSEDARKRILVASLLVSMSFVVFVWVYNLSDRLSNVNSDQAKSSPNPFSVFANSFSSTYRSITASVGNVSFATPKTAETPQKQIDLIPVEYNESKINQ